MSTRLPKPAKCKAGFAQTVITPEPGVHLAGYYHPRVGKTVRDDLYAKAAVIEHNNRKVVIVSLDLICVTAEITERARELINAELGIPSQHVMVCATHTHTGPEIREDKSFPPARTWCEALPAKIAQAVKQAAGKMKTVTLRPGRAIAEGYAFNRLYRMKDGSEQFGKRGREDEVLGEAGPVDPELQTLSMVDEDGKLIGMLANFALHVDVIGGGKADFISADWPGEMAKAISAVYGLDVVMLLLQGTCGDINHVVHDPTNLPRGGPERAILIGRGLAGVAMHSFEVAEPMTEITVDGRMEVLSIPYYTRDEAFMKEVEALRKKKKRAAREDYILNLSENWKHDGENADVPIQVFRIGDTGVAGFPAEIFVGIGLEVKKWAPTESTLLVELANARASTYVPTIDQADRGAYGAKPILSRWLCAEAGSRMSDAAIRMLHELWA